MMRREPKTRSKNGKMGKTMIMIEQETFAEWKERERERE